MQIELGNLFIETLDITGLNFQFYTEQLLVEYESPETPGVMKCIVVPCTRPRYVDIYRVVSNISVYHRLSADIPNVLWREETRWYQLHRTSFVGVPDLLAQIHKLPHTSREDA